MTTWNIEPRVGIGPFRLGESRTMLREGLAQERRIDAPGEPKNDIYPDGGFILGFSDAGVLEFVEVTSKKVVVLDGIDLFATPLSEVVAELSGKGWYSSFSGGGYDFPELQVGLFCPRGDIEGVSIYRFGYYDDL